MALTLTACTDPGERCRANATAELAKLNMMIAEGETALSRGYRESRSVRSIDTMDTCGSLYREGEPCLSQTNLIATHPVAVNKKTEEMRLVDLHERLPNARAKAQTDLALCPQ